MNMPDLSAPVAISTTVNLVQQADENIYLQVLPNSVDASNLTGNVIALCDASGTAITDIIRLWTGWDGGIGSDGIYMKKGSYFKVTRWNISGELRKYYIR